MLLLRDAILLNGHVLNNLGCAYVGGSPIAKCRGDYRNAASMSSGWNDPATALCYEQHRTERSRGEEVGVD